MQYYYFICIPFLDEPVRKPVTVQDMQVKDSKGRARFHGAFTGGFSAGFFNTVGSKDTVQDMQVKDSKGRARFHGAFTGGFSAGFFNTVGSKEGTELHSWLFFRYLKIAKIN